MIGIGSDHGGYDLKQAVIAYLEEKGIAYKDFGCKDKSSCDYPIYGRAVAEAVAVHSIHSKRFVYLLLQRLIDHINSSLVLLFSGKLRMQKSIYNTERQISLEGTLSTLNTELSQVSNNLSELEAKIADKEAEIEETNEMIAVTNQELEEAIAVKDQQYETMKLQIQFMYEKSDDLYLEMLLSAGSFAELLNRSDYIEQLSAYEQKTLQEYKDTQAPVRANASLPLATGENCPD